MEKHKRTINDDDDSQSDSDSGSDTVLFTKTKTQKHRERLERQLQKEQNNLSNNTKSDRICLICEQDDSMENGIVVCSGKCVSAFHVSCLPAESRSALVSKNSIQREHWLCPECTLHQHECFSCKRKSSSEDATMTDASMVMANAEATISSAFVPNNVVRKCQARSCGKFYHDTCISRLPLARIAGTHFICPLHTCAACEQSGAKRESVQCIRCPVAYHSSCLPSHGVRMLSGNQYIICPKHLNDSTSTIKTNVKPSKQSKKDDKKKKKKKKKSKKSKKRSSDSRENDAFEQSTNVPPLKRPKIFQEGLFSPETSDSNPADPLLWKARLVAELGCSDDDETVDVSVNEGKIEEEAVANDNEVLSRQENESSPVRNTNSVSTLTKQSPGKTESIGKLHDEKLASPSTQLADNQYSDEVQIPQVYVGETNPNPFVHAQQQDIPHSESHITLVDCASTPRQAAEVAREKLGGTRKKKSRKSRKASTLDSTHRNSYSLTTGTTASSSTVDDDEDDANWVQCDSCEKWRTVPSTVNLETMPEVWHCHMNYWAPELASCNAKEEVVARNSPSKKSSSLRPSLPQTSLESTSSIEDLDRIVKSSPVTTDITTPHEVSNTSSNKIGMKKLEKAATKKKLKDKSLKDKYGGVKWVQCDNAKCNKWRVVPPSIDASRLPAVWTCNLNTWASELASCSVPNPPDDDTFLLKTQYKINIDRNATNRGSKKEKNSDDTPRSSRTPVNTPSQSWARSSVSEKAAVNTPSGYNDRASNGISDKMKQRKLKVQDLTTPNSSNTTANTNHSAKAVVEWAQCEKCNKWRQLPPHIKSSSLPDIWYCSMKHWDPTRASCSFPEQKEQDPSLVAMNAGVSGRNWVPGSGGTKAIGGYQSNRSNPRGVNNGKSKRGKLSYSELIYASTGHIRKTYTSESSTLAFEHNGVTYFRDEQYRNSSMYVAPNIPESYSHQRLLSAQRKNSYNESDGDIAYDITTIQSSNQQAVAHMVSELMKSLTIRHDKSILELIQEFCQSDMSQMAVLAEALSKLLRDGIVEKIEKVETAETADSYSFQRRIYEGNAIDTCPYYRKIPQRPLKASKTWLKESRVQHP